MKKYTLVVVLIICIVILTACQKTPNYTNESDMVTSRPNIEADINSDVPDVANEDIDIDLSEQTAEILTQSDGKLFDRIIGDSDSKQIAINATVDIGEVDTVGSYQYVLVPVSDELRENLFSSFFGDKANNAEYDERNDLWKYKNSEAIGDYFLYDTVYPHAGETISGEESFYLEYRDVNLYPFEDNLLDSVDKLSDKIPLENVLDECEEILNILVSDEYEVDYVHAYGTNGRHPYYKIVYKRIIGDAILTGFNDICFLVDSNGIQKIFGSVFNVSPLSADTKLIISADEAVEALENNITLIDFESDVINIGKITFEYVVVNNLERNAEIVPVWRFVIGSTDDQMNLHRNKIIAVNAITGEIVCSERGGSF